jgi:archaemetzincin
MAACEAGGSGSALGACNGNLCRPLRGLIVLSDSCLYAVACFARLKDISALTTMTVPQIKFVAIGHVDRELLDFLMLTVPERFDAETVEVRANLNIQSTYNVARRQYHSTELLAQLRELAPLDNSKILGVTDLDLFIPIFTFVFGEAQVKGRAALMSTHRLHQDFYGLPGDGQLLFARAEKEAIHELGHVFGFAHCRNLDCVMRFSNSVEEVDLKTCNFCQLCEARLRARSGSKLAA